MLSSKFFPTPSVHYTVDMYTAPATSYAAFSWECNKNIQAQFPPATFLNSTLSSRELFYRFLRAKYVNTEYETTCIVVNYRVDLI